MNISDRLRIVLVDTTLPENIGAAARAMKTMGLRSLALVNPEGYPSAAATAMASGADDVLAEAAVHDSLERALEGARLVYGTSARLRSVEVPQRAPREMARRAVAVAGDATVAVVFGRERYGLTNDQLARCHELVNIPADKDYSSLNLAQAVQVICYELRLAWLEVRQRGAGEVARELAAAEHLEGFFQHLEKTLTDIDFLHADQTTTMLLRLRRLFMRAEASDMEINILRGILSQVDKVRREAENSETEK